MEKDQKNFYADTWFQDELSHAISVKQYFYPQGKSKLSHLYGRNLSKSVATYDNETMRNKKQPISYPYVDIWFQDE